MHNDPPHPRKKRKKRIRCSLFDLVRSIDLSGYGLILKKCRGGRCQGLILIRRVRRWHDCLILTCGGVTDTPSLHYRRHRTTICHHPVLHPGHPIGHHPMFHPGHRIRHHLILHPGHRIRHHPILHPGHCIGHHPILHPAGHRIGHHPIHKQHDGH